MATRAAVGHNVNCLLTRPLLLGLAVHRLLQARENRREA